jgi:uncharacterized protein YndB with AHSA1/START domain
MKTILHLVDVAAHPKKLFAALDSPDGLAGWWTTAVSGDAGPGGTIEFNFVDFNPEMQVTELRPPTRVAWRCVGGVEEWADNSFSFELEERDGATRLRFRQDYATELSDDQYGSFNYNWGYYLDSLKLYCETGRGKPFAART